MSARDAAVSSRTRPSSRMAGRTAPLLNCILQSCMVSFPAGASPPPVAAVPNMGERCACLQAKPSRVARLSNRDVSGTHPPKVFIILAAPVAAVKSARRYPFRSAPRLWITLDAELPPAYSNPLVQPAESLTIVGERDYKEDVSPRDLLVKDGEMVDATTW